MFNSAAVAVTPSRMFNSLTVAVIPSKVLSSVAVAVTPSRMFNSAAEAVTAVPANANPEAIFVCPEPLGVIVIFPLTPLAICTVPLLTPSSVLRVKSAAPSVVIVTSSLVLPTRTVSDTILRLPSPLGVIVRWPLVADPTMLSVLTLAQIVPTDPSVRSTVVPTDTGLTLSPSYIFHSPASASLKITEYLVPSETYLALMP